MNPSQTRQLALDAAEQVIRGIAGAAEREAARRRAEACTEWIFWRAEYETIPRIRFIARWRARRLWRRSFNRCKSMQAKTGCKVAQAVLDFGRDRGLA